MKTSKHEEVRRFQQMTAPLVEKKLPELLNPWGRAGFAIRLAAEVFVDAVKHSFRQAKQLAEWSMAASEMQERARKIVKLEAEKARRQKEK